MRQQKVAIDPGASTKESGKNPQNKIDKDRYQDRLVIGAMDFSFQVRYRFHIKSPHTLICEVIL